MRKYFLYQNPNNPRPYRINRPFWPHHAMMEFCWAVFMFAILLTLATYFPAPLHEKADPYSTPEHIKPEWYFLAAYQSLKVAEYLAFLGPWAPKLIGVLSQGVAVGLMIFWPFIDRGKEENPFKRPKALIVGALGFLGFVGLTIWGHFS